MNHFVHVDPARFHQNFGSRPFLIEHQLVDHPLLRLERLVELCQTLQPESIEYNAGDLPVHQDPSRTPRNGLSVEETIRRIHEARSWMVLKNVERDPAYAALLNECLAQVATLVPRAESGMRRKEAFIFVSSPGSVTPYHIDPEQNILLQIQGHKTMHVFDRNHPEVLPDQELERCFAGGHRNLTYREDFERHAQVFELTPGKALHVPVSAPHWVKNGTEVSISFSITYRTPATERRAGVYQLNARLRALGIKPTRYGRSALLDTAKYSAIRALWRLERAGLPIPGAAPRREMQGMAAEPPMAAE